MTGPRHAVRVTIGGEEFTVRSELSPEYTQEVAAYFDRMLRDIRGSLPTVEVHKVAILAGLDGLAQRDQGAYLAKATASAVRG